VSLGLEWSGLVWSGLDWFGVGWRGLEKVWSTLQEEMGDLDERSISTGRGSRGSKGVSDVRGLVSSVSCGL